MRDVLANIKNPVDEALQHINDVENKRSDFRQGAKDPAIVTHALADARKALTALYTKAALQKADHLRLVERLAKLSRSPVMYRAVFTAAWLLAGCHPQLDVRTTCHCDEYVCALELRLLSATHRRQAAESKMKLAVFHETQRDAGILTMDYGQEMNEAKALLADASADELTTRTKLQECQNCQRSLGSSVQCREDESAP
jgi:hypothetical protein